MLDVQQLTGGTCPLRGLKITVAGTSWEIMARFKSRIHMNCLVLFKLLHLYAAFLPVDAALDCVNGIVANRVMRPPR